MSCPRLSANQRIFRYWVEESVGFEIYYNNYIPPAFSELDREVQLVEPRTSKPKVAGLNPALWSSSFSFTQRIRSFRGHLKVSMKWKFTVCKNSSKMKNGFYSSFICRPDLKLYVVLLIWIITSLNGYVIVTKKNHENHAYLWIEWTKLDQTLWTWTDKQTKYKYSLHAICCYGCHSNRLVCRPLLSEHGFFNIRLLSIKVSFKLCCCIENRTEIMSTC